MEEEHEHVYDPRTEMTLEDQLQVNSAKQNLSFSSFSQLLICLPANLFNLICLSLSAPEIAALIGTSRALREKVMTQAKLSLSILAIKLFCNCDSIDNYVEYGEEEVYVAARTQRNRFLAETLKEEGIQNLS
jgi:hypothetical protein